MYTFKRNENLEIAQHTCQTTQWPNLKKEAQLSLLEAVNSIPGSIGKVPKFTYLR